MAKRQCSPGLLLSASGFAGGDSIDALRRHLDTRMTRQERLLEQLLLLQHRCAGEGFSHVDGAVAVGDVIPEAEVQSSRSRTPDPVASASALSFNSNVPTSPSRSRTSQQVQQSVRRNSRDSNQVELTAPSPTQRIRKAATKRLSTGDEVDEMDEEDIERKTAAEQQVSAKWNGSGLSAGENKSKLSCRARFRSVVASNHFELVFAVAIITNSILIGVNIEYQAISLESETPLLLTLLEHTYSLAFLIELLLRVAAEGPVSFWRCGPNMFWNYLDTIIVATSMVEMLFEAYYVLQSKASSSQTNMSGVRILRIVRVTRLVRIFRITRIMRFVRALRTLVHSILVTLKSLVWAMLLLFMIVYVFSILFTQSTIEFLIAAKQVSNGPGCRADDLEALRIYWSSLFRSMFTLFKAISGGVSWDMVVTPLEHVDYALVFLFFIYISFAYFAVLNVVTGVFCQSAIESTQRDQELMVQQVLMNRKAIVEKITKLFTQIDGLDCGYITIKEFEQNLQDHAVQAYFATLDLDTADAWTLFKLIDVDKSGRIEINDFVDGCMRLRGVAKAMDIARILHENKWMRMKMTEIVIYMEEQFSSIARLSSERANAMSCLIASLAASSNGSELEVVSAQLDVVKAPLQLALPDLAFEAPPSPMPNWAAVHLDRDAADPLASTSTPLAFAPRSL